MTIRKALKALKGEYTRVTSLLLDRDFTSTDNLCPLRGSVSNFGWLYREDKGEYSMELRELSELGP